MFFVWQVITDNTGANYVRFKCRYFKDEYSGLDLSVSPGSGSYGYYGEWSQACPVNSAICGIKTKIEDKKGIFDDTALNDVEFFCCE